MVSHAFWRGLRANATKRGDDARSQQDCGGEADSFTCGAGARFPDGPTFCRPFAEFVLGILIVTGLFTRCALTVGGLLITALIFGTALRSDWSTIGIQMIYAITYYRLLLNRADNGFSLDTLFFRDGG